MPLEPCVDCGRRISDEAETCPHCGKPDPCADVVEATPATFLGKAFHALGICMGLTLVLAWYALLGLPIWIVVYLFWKN